MTVWTWPPREVAGASASSHRHVQGVASDVWTITHGLTFWPNVTVVDSSGEQVEASIDYPDSATVVVTFAGPVSGEAFLS